MTYYVAISRSIYPACNLNELRDLLKQAPGAKVYYSNGFEVDLTRLDLTTGKYPNSKKQSR